MTDGYDSNYSRSDQEIQSSAIQENLLASNIKYVCGVIDSD